MKNKLFKVLPKAYLVMMGILTSWFLLQLAYANPLCIHCSVTLIKWSMPRAEILVFGWLVAGMGAIWLHREVIVEYCKMLKGNTHKTEHS